MKNHTARPACIDEFEKEYNVKVLEWKYVEEEYWRPTAIQHANGRISRFEEERGSED